MFLATILRPNELPLSGKHSSHSKPLPLCNYGAEMSALSCGGFLNSQEGHSYRTSKPSFHALHAFLSYARGRIELGKILPHHNFGHCINFDSGTIPKPKSVYLCHL